MRKLTLLTPTGARPKVWSLCEYFMSRQTFKGPVRWVVVDDGTVPQKITFSKPNWELEVIRPMPYWINGQNTQARNLSEGLKRISEDEWVAVIEDDDYYSPGYLEHVHIWLHLRDLVGEGFSRYFNASTKRGQFMLNSSHASLCSTAVKGRALADLKRIVNSSPKCIDLQLWRSQAGQIFTTKHVVGIKGLPGRSGIGVGHRDNFGVPMKLSTLIGEDAKIYEARFPEIFCSGTQK